MYIKLFPIEYRTFLLKVKQYFGKDGSFSITFSLKWNNVWERIELFLLKHCMYGTFSY
jgi:hypothetical protein